jgi:hypothetical protein
MDVLVLPLTISLLSPNHRPKPPFEYLDLDREKNPGSNPIAKQEVTKADQRVQPKTGVVPSPGLAHKTARLQCAQSTLCDYEKCVK